MGSVRWVVVRVRERERAWREHGEREVAKRAIVGAVAYGRWYDIIIDNITAAFERRGAGCHGDKAGLCGTYKVGIYNIHLPVMNEAP